MASLISNARAWFRKIINQYRIKSWAHKYSDAGGLPMYALTLNRLMDIQRLTRATNLDKQVSTSVCNYSTTIYKYFFSFASYSIKKSFKFNVNRCLFFLVMNFILHQLMWIVVFCKCRMSKVRVRLGEKFFCVDLYLEMNNEIF